MTRLELIDKLVKRRRESLRRLKRITKRTKAISRNELEMLLAGKDDGEAAWPNWMKLKYTKPRR